MIWVTISKKESVNKTYVRHITNDTCWYGKERNLIIHGEPIEKVGRK